MTCGRKREQGKTVEVMSSSNSNGLVGEESETGEAGQHPSHQEWLR